MIETLRDTMEMSFLEKARELLDQGRIDDALEHYQQAFDPDSLDERESRNMLIEARAQLSRKYLKDALENFEEALVMGTEIQRQQAMEGILAVARIRSKLSALSHLLKRGFKERLGKRDPASLGLLPLPDEENVILISQEALESLPNHLITGHRIGRIPARISDKNLPFTADKCVAYADESDVHYILEITMALKRAAESKQLDRAAYGTASIS